MTVTSQRDGAVTVVTIDRPERRNAVDLATSRSLTQAFQDFAANPEASVAVLTGAGDAFCAGADLKAIAAGETGHERRHQDSAGPMGPTRLRLPKPVIAAVEGPAVAGGLELALWCDLRVASETATFGVLCRRFGVPLVDLGTVRLPRLIGQSRAMDLILTGRLVDAAEALSFGLVNRLVPAGTARAAALELAHQIAAAPQLCMRQDRLSVLEQWDLDEAAAMRNELAHGELVFASGEAVSGATAFTAGAGRHGRGVAQGTRQTARA